MKLRATTSTQSYRAKGDLDHAIADFTAVLRIYPDDDAALKNRGEAYQAKRDYDRAIQDYSRYIELHPNHASQGFNGRGEVYVAKGDYDRAIADFDAAIRLDPKFSEAIKNRALAIEKKQSSSRN